MRVVNGEYTPLSTSYVTVPARVSQLSQFSLDYLSDLWPADWLVYDTFQPNVSLTCQYITTDVMHDPSVTYLNFTNQYGQILNDAMLKADLFPNATDTTGFDAASSLVIPNRGTHGKYQLLDVTKNVTTQVWRDPPKDNTAFSSVTALSSWGPDAANRTTSTGCFACAIFAEWAPVEANYSLSNYVLTYQPRRRPADEDAGTRKPAIRLPSAWLRRLTAEYLEYGPEGLESSMWDGASDMMLILALADYGPDPMEEGRSTYSVSPTGRSCLCFGKDCCDWINEGGIRGQQPVKQCDALRAHMHDNGLFEGYQKFREVTRPHEPSGTALLYSTKDWTDPATLQYMKLESYNSGYGYSSATTPVRLSLFILCTYILAMLSYLGYVLVTGLSATSWDSFAELLMLALNSHHPQQLEATSVGVDTLAAFREPVNIRINAQHSAEIVFKNDVDVDQARYRKVVMNSKY